MFIQVSIKKNKNDDVMTININAIQQIYPSNLGTAIVFRGSSKKEMSKIIVMEGYSQVLDKIAKLTVVGDTTPIDIPSLLQSNNILYER